MASLQPPPRLKPLTSCPKHPPQFCEGRTVMSDKFRYVDTLPERNETLDEIGAHERQNGREHTSSKIQIEGNAFEIRACVRGVTRNTRRGHRE